MEGLAEHLEARGEKEVTYELVVDPPRRTVGIHLGGIASSKLT